MNETQKKFNFSKKQKAIGIGVILVVALVIVMLFLPSHFERVKDDAVDIAGRISSRGEGNFTIDTYPYEDTNMNPGVIAFLAKETQDKALEAIQYVNEEFGFSSYLFNQMMETTASMGTLSDENDKYRVTWNYHPDKGLEVTYYEK